MPKEKLKRKSRGGCCACRESLTHAVHLRHIINALMFHDLEVDCWCIKYRKERRSEGATATEVKTRYARTKDVTMFFCGDNSMYSMTIERIIIVVRLLFGRNKIRIASTSTMLG